MTAATDRSATSARPPGLTRWNDDTIAGLVVLLLSAAAFTLTYRFDSVPEILAQNIPPTYFPRVVLVAMGAMSAGLLAQGLRRREVRKPAVPRSVFVTGAFTAVCVLNLESLGLVGLTGLTSLVLPVLFGERRPFRIVLFALLTPAVIYLLFGWLLRMQLPPGFLESVL